MSVYTMLHILRINMNLRLTLLLWKVNVSPAEGQRYSCGNTGVYIFFSVVGYHPSERGVYLLCGMNTIENLQQTDYISNYHTTTTTPLLCVLNICISIPMRKLLLFMLITTYINMVIQLNLNVTIPNCTLSEKLC